MSEHVGRRCQRSGVSGRDVLQRNLKGLGFNLLCVAPRSNGLVVPDFGCWKQTVGDGVGDEVGGE